MESSDRITAYPARAELALRRITNRKVAQAAGVSEQTVGRGVNGMQRPDPRVIAACAELTGVAPELLFPDDAPVLYRAVRELVRRSAET